MRYYCDYCDMYLPHGSSKSRRQHNYGWKHRANYKAFYQNLFLKQQKEVLAKKRHLLPAAVVAQIERELAQFQQPMGGGGMSAGAPQVIGRGGAVHGIPTQTINPLIHQVQQGSNQSRFAMPSNAGRPPRF